MVEIALGSLLVLGAVAVLTGVPAMLGAGDLFPLVGLGGTGALTAMGVALAARGGYRLALKRTRAGRHALRAAGLLAVALGTVAIFTLGMPLWVEPMNLVRIGGFPLGYYFAAQGALIALVMLAFLVARAADTIDAEEGSSGAGTPGA